MRTRTDRTARGARKGARGFTLIELMVVIVILGLLIGLVGPNVWHALTSGTMETAKNQMKGIADAIGFYKIEKRSLPRTLDELAQPSEKSGKPFIETIPLDPWGQPYTLTVDDRNDRYEITCSGEDRMIGTEDDLFWPERTAK